MLTGGTSKADIRDINSRLIAMASSNSVESQEIKLCYVTVSAVFDHSDGIYMSRYAISRRKLRGTNNFCPCLRN